MSTTRRDESQAQGPAEVDAFRLARQVFDADGVTPDPVPAPD